MTSTFGDNVTVVDDSAPYKGRDDTFRKSSGSQPSKSKSRTAFTGKARMPHVESEFTTVDYNIEERPFFIPIGKAGVIDALEKLDRQLLEVRVSCQVYCDHDPNYCFQANRTRLLSKKVPTDWTGREIVPGQLGLINHG
jgi:hypothetical protein